MTEELERLMRQARDYPNTATVDLLCEAVRKRLAQMEVHDNFQPEYGQTGEASKYSR
jgi:hypothetical protein